MFSGKPIAQETRQWLAGDVMPAIADTGGYLLNEAARETARADTRQTMPLPEHLGGAYEALIAEKRKNIALEMQLIERLQAAATEEAERRRLEVALMEAKAREEVERQKAGRLAPRAAVGDKVVAVERP